MCSLFLVQRKISSKTLKQLTALELSPLFSTESLFCVRRIGAQCVATVRECRLNYKSSFGFGHVPYFVFCIGSDTLLVVHLLGLTRKLGQMTSSQKMIRNKNMGRGTNLFLLSSFTMATSDLMGKACARSFKREGVFCNVFHDQKLPLLVCPRKQQSQIFSQLLNFQLGLAFPSLGHSSCVLIQSGMLHLIQTIYHKFRIPKLNIFSTWCKKSLLPNGSFHMIVR